MAIDFYAALLSEISAPINAALQAQGVQDSVQLAPPSREGQGDLACPCHKYAKALHKAPQMIASDLGQSLKDLPQVASAEAVAGFLNIRLNWPEIAREVIEWAEKDDGALGQSNALAGQKVMIEYSSPNTNKPQHLGHCRNNILGCTVARLMAAAGAEVTRVNLVNDRGIHICKSMVAYKKFADGQTPESWGKKGDHMVGDLYVKFEQALVAEYKDRYPEEPRPSKDDFFNTESKLGAEAHEMLRAWEQGDPEVRALWKMMNGWCESGFAETYARMGVQFDRIDHESETYLLGKDLVQEGLDRGIFHKAANGAVVYDLSRMGLEGEKAVLRADGTSVYTTQDLGTATRRYAQCNFDQMIYVVGNEQDRHFQVLFQILAELRPELAGRLFHLSYGMVELPTGKMKSREGKVVDADDLMDDLHETALAKCKELWPDLDPVELDRRAEALGLSGLKYFLLKFAPTTTFMFDAEASIKPEGETGVYCQYAYARGKSILRKLEASNQAEAVKAAAPDYSALDQEQARALMSALLMFPRDVAQAARDLKPSMVTKSVFEISKRFAAFYNHPECRVIGAEPAVAAARAALVRATSRVIGGALDLLGITALEEM